MARGRAAREAWAAKQAAAVQASSIVGPAVDEVKTVIYNGRDRSRCVTACVYCWRMRVARNAETETPP